MHAATWDYTANNAGKTMMAKVINLPVQSKVSVTVHCHAHGGTRANVYIFIDGKIAGLNDLKTFKGNHEYIHGWGFAHTTEWDVISSRSFNILPPGDHNIEIILDGTDTKTVYAAGAAMKIDIEPVFA